jgi:hypothetical protein
MAVGFFLMLAIAPSLYRPQLAWLPAKDSISVDFISIVVTNIFSRKSRFTPVFFRAHE